MWPMRMDMSWDECRQCLRCLELDAYGNMVSVLRAQGPFTEDKKKLLGELAKVLHITNERHRAEVRRAVNDEKLSLIAERLNGPNTWTDWAIEGRRTIPLLPRLKSHTAFTGLANSLSLVIAAANEKKIPNKEEQESIATVKVDQSTHCKEAVENKRTLKCSIQNHQGSSRGKKRKRSVSDAGDVKSIKQNVNRKLNNDSNVNSLNIRGQNSLSPLPINYLHDQLTDFSSNQSSCFDKLHIKKSIACTISPIGASKWDNNIDNINSITCHDSAKAQSKITAINMNSNTDVHLELEERLSCRIDEIDAVDIRIDSKKNNFEPDSFINEDSNTLTCENTQFSPSEGDKTSGPAPSQPLSPINLGVTSSSGPGPPKMTSSIRLHSDLSSEALNHNTTEMEIIFSSNNTVNINNLPKVKFDGQTRNIYSIQKGPVQGIKLTPNGKKVLGRVVSSNANQTVNMTSMSKSSNANNVDVADINLETDNMVVLDIRQNAPVDKKSHTINNEIAIDLFNSDKKTVLSKMDAHNLVEYSSKDCSSMLAHQMDIINIENNLADSENVNRGLSVNENVDIETAVGIQDQIECEEILISSEPHVVIDGETEIYNFESTDDGVCEIQIEDNPQVIEAYNTELTTGINIDHFNYVADDEETVSIPEDERGHYEQFNDLSDS